MKLFYDAKLGADCLGISVSMYYKLVRDGTLSPPHKIGTRSLWLYKDIESAAHAIPKGKKGNGK
jgi:predicted DNA-binding transcriptional regulator AlpA